MNLTEFYPGAKQTKEHITENVLLLPTPGKVLCIPIDAIIRVEASSNYSRVYCKDHRFPIVVAKVVKWFEERLPVQLFTRIHRKHLVNSLYVVAWRKTSITLESGNKITISRRKRKLCLSERRERNIAPFK